MVIALSLAALVSLPLFRLGRMLALRWRRRRHAAGGTEMVTVA